MTFSIDYVWMNWEDRRTATAAGVGRCVMMKQIYAHSAALSRFDFPRPCQPIICCLICSLPPKSIENLAFSFLIRLASPSSANSLLLRLSPRMATLLASPLSQISVTAFSKEENGQYRPAKNIEAFNSLLPPAVEFVEGSSTGVLAVAQGKYEPINGSPKLRAAEVSNRSSTSLFLS